MIWCISKYALPPKYGAQARLFHISDELNKLSLESIVICSATNHLAEMPNQIIDYKSEVIGNSKTVFLKGLKFSNSLSKNRVLSWFYFEWKLYNFIRSGYKHFSQKPNVVLVSSLSLMTILNGYYAKRKFGAKLIFEVRDIWPLSAILVAGYSKWHPFILFLRWVEKFGYKNADIIVSPLGNLKQHIKESISNKPFIFRYVPQGFDINLLNTSDKLPLDFVEKYIPKDKFIFGYIGNIVSAYDLDTLIMCAREVNAVSDKIHFLILGDGDYKETLINASADLLNITFIPRIPKHQISDFLNYCHVATNFLRPEPLFKYGVSPQKLVDYMLASKPILMSYSGYQTIVQELNNGIVVEAANINKLVEAILNMSKMTDSELSIMGKRGYEYLTKSLSWKSIVFENSDLFV
jgi:glycosyltransferase involved in cell wall biosynthesis